MKYASPAAKLSRRKFLQSAAMTSGAILLSRPTSAFAEGTTLKVSEAIGSLRMEEGRTPIPGATWFMAEKSGDGLAHRFTPGFLTKTRYLTTDIVTEGTDLTVFSVTLQEGDNGPEFRCNVGVLPECSARLRLSMEFIDQHRGVLDREGALVKPQCYGQAIDLSAVDRVMFTVASKHPGTARWCMTPLVSETGTVGRIAKPVLPKGKLLDEMGQSTLRCWPGKMPNAHELTRRIQSQWRSLPQQAWPEKFSRWGGWKSRKLIAGEGFFRTHHDGKRWWLVDPDGYAFWSTGLDCVSVEQCLTACEGLESALTLQPDVNGEFRDAYLRFSHLDGSPIAESGNERTKHINYLAANLIRALGADGWRDKWAKIAMGEMKRMCFNTVGNWSDFAYAQSAKFPYVRPMGFNAKRSGWIYRDFPDVFHPEFVADAAEFASVLARTAADPAMIGYFMMNEPLWGGASTILPMEGALFNTESCCTRREFAGFLKKRYADESSLSAKWKMSVTFAQVERGRWRRAMSAESQEDLRDFCAIMTERLFSELASACRKADPNHLNLGVRYSTVPPAWVASGMKSFDVFSMNRYAERVPHDAFAEAHRLLGKPVIVGEFGFGALDVGLPATGPAPRLKNQLERGKEYRLFVEDAAADPYCVGAHWFQMYDQSAIGRPDGECYNLGLIDVCNQPYEEMEEATAATNARIYEVADGQATAFAEVPEYQPQVSM